MKIKRQWKINRYDFEMKSSLSVEECTLVNQGDLWTWEGSERLKIAEHDWLEEHRMQMAQAEINRWEEKPRRRKLKELAFLYVTDDPLRKPSVDINPNRALILVKKSVQLGKNIWDNKFQVNLKYNCNLYRVWHLRFDGHPTSYNSKDVASLLSAGTD